MKKLAILKSAVLIPGKKLWIKSNIFLVVIFLSMIICPIPHHVVQAVSYPGPIITEYMYNIQSGISTDINIPKFSISSTFGYTYVCWSTYSCYPNIRITEGGFTPILPEANVTYYLRAIQCSFNSICSKISTFTYIHTIPHTTPPGTYVSSLPSGWTNAASV